MNKMSDMVDEATAEKLESIKSDADIITDLKIPFTPIDDRVLIKPMDEVKITKTIVVPDDEANEGRRPDEVQETKEVTEEVPSNLRVGVVLAVGPTNLNERTPFKVGDKVVYVHRAAMPFDLFKDSVLLRRFEILGLWSK